MSSNSTVYRILQAKVTVDKNVALLFGSCVFAGDQNNKHSIHVRVICASIVYKALLDCNENGNTNHRVRARFGMCYS